MPEITPYRIALDSEWTFFNLASFSHEYTQVYAFLYSLILQAPVREKFTGSPTIADPYKRYPWRGGFSSLNFYYRLHQEMEKEHRLKINSMQFSSPGYIEIIAVAAIATQIERIVKAVANSIEIAEKTYDHLHQRAQKRKLLAMDVRLKERELDKQEIWLLVESAKELSRVMKFEDLERLQKRTNDSLATFKILFSFYRRVKGLVDFELSKQVKFGEQPKIGNIPDKRSDQ